MQKWLTSNCILILCVLLLHYVRFSLHNEALQQSAVNPETGLVEVNIIATGFSDKHKKKVQLIADLISQELGQKKGNFSLVKLYKEIRLTNKVS